jgi:sensor histidine kinase YesM
MASSLNVSTDVALVDTRTAAGSIQLPFTNDILYRVFTIKDAYGSFDSNALTVTTQSNETFEDGTTSKIFSDKFSYITLYANTENSMWQILSTTQYKQITVSSIVGISSIQGGTISAKLFPVYYNTIISTVRTGQTMFLPATTSGSYVFITSSNVSTSNVSVSLPTTSVPTGSLFVIKHKGQTGGVNSVRILNTSSSLPASTTMTAVYSGIEWMSLGVSPVG